MSQRMLFHATARLKGWYQWRAYDKGGRPILVDVLDRHGQLKARRHAGPVMPNLILDNGIDWLFTETGSMGNWRQTLVVGTGSAAPDVTDAALGSAVSTTAHGGESVSNTGGDVGDNYVYSSEVIRRRELTTAENLTEFGFNTSSAVVLSIRELFRDELGDPITLSGMQPGNIIEVKHTLDITAPRKGVEGQFDIEERDAANTLVDTVSYDIEGGFYARAAGRDMFVNFIRAWPNSGFTLTYFASAFDLPTLGASGGSGTTNMATTRSTYTAGTFQVDRDIRPSLNQVNGVWYGFSYASYITSDSNGAAGYNVKLVTPTTFEKLDTHTMSLAFRHSLARA